MRSSQPRRIGASMLQIDEGAVAGEQVEQAQEQQELRERSASKPPETAASQTRYMTQNTGLNSADSTVPPMKNTNPRKPSGPAGAQQMQRPPGVDQEGLHVAFHPARALPDPVAGMAGRFLEGGGIDDADAIALLRQADAEIGVLGDVEGIPAVQFAQHVDLEMVRGAAERNRHVEPLEPRQHLVEPQRVIEREHAGEPVLGGVVIVEPALEAGGVGRRPAERRHDLAQLIGLRPVLGVEDDEDIRRARIAARNCRPSAWSAAARAAPG